MCIRDRATEGRHRHRVAAQVAHGADVGGGGLRGRRGAHEHAVVPVKGLRHQGHDAGATAAKDKDIDGHALGLFPVGRDDRALARRGREAGIGTVSYTHLDVYKRQDLYRFIYEKKKIESQYEVPNMHRVSPEDFDPYPGEFLKDDLEDKICLLYTSCMSGMDRKEPFFKLYLRTRCKGLL